MVFIFVYFYLKNPEIRVVKESIPSYTFSIINASLSKRESKAADRGVGDPGPHAMCLHVMRAGVHACACEPSVNHVHIPFEFGEPTKTSLRTKTGCSPREHGC